MAALPGLLTRSLHLPSFVSSELNSSKPKSDQIALVLSKPTVYEEVHRSLKLYGFNSISYMALEADKQHFFHPVTAAVTAYAMFNRVALAAGEPICSDPELALAIDEFLHFTKQRSWRPLFFEVTEPTVPLLQERGFNLLKLGEEPFFELNRFSLKGNKMSNVRSSGKTATKRGVMVREHFPLTSEAEAVNAQLEEISCQWLAGRGLGQISFTLSGLSLDHPGNRRYFIAEQDGNVVGFLTYTPIYARQGVYLDMMRRSATAPTGTMDLLITESFRLLHDSGVKLATLGMSPLANVQETSVKQSKRLSWLLNQLYQRGHKLYNYKQLHDFKQKFHPHYWESKYLAYKGLGFAEVDAIVQAVQGKTIARIGWELLNQPLF